MKTMTVDEAQGRLLELVQMVAAGEEVELIQHDRPVARLVPSDWDAKPVDWRESWSKVDAIFGPTPIRGKAGSRIVLDARR